MASISMILQSATVKPVIGNVRPRSVITIPATPFTRAACSSAPRGAAQTCLTGNGCCATGDLGGGGAVFRQSRSAARRRDRPAPRGRRNRRQMPQRRPLLPAPSSKIRISSRYLGTFDPSAFLASWLTAGALGRAMTQLAADVKTPPCDARKWVLSGMDPHRAARGERAMSVARPYLLAKGGGRVQGERHIRDLSTSNSAPGEDGSKPCSISQRAAPRLRHDHHARITSRSTSVP